MASEHAFFARDDFQTFDAAFIARVRDKAVRFRERGRSEIIVAPRVERAGRVATRAENAINKFVNAFALLRRLQAFLLRRIFHRDQVRAYLFVLAPERGHIHDQVFEYR